MNYEKSNFRFKMNSFRPFAFEIHISKSVDFLTFIYEVNTIYSCTIRIMCYVKA